ncbi:thiamine pyrophosphate-binding protein [Betaproteobacteria bacterium]|nr:thiamine pyrophosphate-binding protein [Betaproteobacteria bacterium]
MRVADIIANTLVEHNIFDVFMITGGAAMHLNDSIGNHPKLKYYCCHHEQSSAIAAESYFRLSGKIALVQVTAGPGAINTLNGVFGAYVDSIGMVVISGQSKRETLARNCRVPTRQLGDQEVNIVQMVKGITKYATVLDNPNNVKLTLQKAIYLAGNGRPGPVWIDVPIDVQASGVNINNLVEFNEDDTISILNDDDVSENTKMEFTLEPNLEVRKKIRKLIGRLNQSKRPVIFAGSGIRIANQKVEFDSFVERLGIPVVSGWNAHDVIPNDSINFCGRPGSVGDRGGNFAVQNSDFLLILGSRLNIRQVSYNWKNFGKNAFKIHVDVDKAELEKPTLDSDIKIHSNLQTFFKIFNEESQNVIRNDEHAKYLAWCRNLVAKYPVVLDHYRNSKKINPYYLMETIFSKLKEDDVIVTGDGTACVTSFQAAYIKKNQRLYTNSGCASMGYDLPAAIGASLSKNKKEIICITGDGSLMFNIQELQTIKKYSLPIKIILLNNNGYHSIRQTQKNHFSDRAEVGVGPNSGVDFPDFKKIAEAFCLNYILLNENNGIEEKIENMLAEKENWLCEVILDMEQDFSPKLASFKNEDGSMSTPSLENMAPFLSKEELQNNIL